ncbi:MAG: bifunctional oligoribonuclease/PAP phosphatase NrnA [Bacteroidales bacterium]|nr:bifunctional oligoribonuclease/PAP phosphatase NrnA [Bacteroidales bacterium]
MYFKNVDFSELKVLLFDGNKSITVVTHINPDGDAIGSALALSNLFVNMGHHANVIVPNNFPSFLRWMKNAEKIVVASKSPDKTSQLIKDAEILFAVDFNDISRIIEFNDAWNKSRGYKVLIDHHPNPKILTNLILSVTEVSSASELVYQFIQTIGAVEYVDKDVATCIYTGIMADTGCFSFNSSFTSTFNTVADLIDKGIDKDKIYDLVYDNYSFDRMRLLGYCLNNKLTHLPEKGAAYITITQKELKDHNFKIGDTEGFVNMPLSIKGINISALFIEKKNMIKVSIRSKGAIPVNKMAEEHFNGGGHVNAAGGESYESLDETVDKFVNLLSNQNYNVTD